MRRRRLGAHQKYSILRIGRGGDGDGVGRKVGEARGEGGGGAEIGM